MRKTFCVPDTLPYTNCAGIAYHHVMAGDLELIIHSILSFPSSRKYRNKGVAMLPSMSSFITPFGDTDENKFRKLFLDYQSKWKNRSLNEIECINLFCEYKAELPKKPKTQ